MNMSGFRSQQPLNDDDFAAIRRNVMTAIAARNERRFFPIVMRYAIAAAVIVAIGIALVPRRAATPSAAAPAKRTVVMASAPAPVPAPIVAPVTTQPPIARVAHRPRQRRAPHIDLARQNIRVEFRTSDPDVRIIWIASQTPPQTGGKS
ncbi:MAG TPA: hypothetical protein VN380_25280 [Thermoanaerobaculia bacterium]|jgi:hypothetical protein|nr:hypothetical protein [Thermoanaerobaculia bacterium]